MNVGELKRANGRAHQAVRRRRERSVELRIVSGDFVDALDFVEVERELAGDRAVQSGFQVRRPVLAEDVLAARVFLAHAGDSRVHALPAVDVLDGGFSEEE